MLETHPAFADHGDLGLVPLTTSPLACVPVRSTDTTGRTGHCYGNNLVGYRVVCAALP